MGDPMELMCWCGDRLTEIRSGIKCNCAKLDAGPYGIDVLVRLYNNMKLEITHVFIAKLCSTCGLIVCCLEGAT